MNRRKFLTGLAGAAAVPVVAVVASAIPAAPEDPRIAELVANWKRLAPDLQESFHFLIGSAAKKSGSRAA